MGQWEAQVVPGLLKLKPYVPGKTVEEVERELGLKGPLKVASNEHAYGPSPKVISALKESLDELYRYPDPVDHVLRTALSHYHGLPMASILCGNGSNELINLLVKGLVKQDEEVLSGDISFIAYGIAAKSLERRFQSVKMTDGLGFDCQALLQAVSEKTRLVFVSNPNNPTGSYLQEGAISAFLEGLEEKGFQSGPPYVVLDEAYIHFVDEERFGKGCQEASLRLMKRHPRLIVLRTFSKAYGLAALRMGYALLDPELAGYLNRIREPFNTNQLAQVAALHALQDEAWLREGAKKIMAEREGLARAFSELGFKVYESQANFLLIEGQEAAESLYERVLKEGVIVRPLGGPSLSRCLRVTVAKEDENRRTLEAFRLALA